MNTLHTHTTTHPSLLLLLLLGTLLFGFMGPAAQAADSDEQAALQLIAQSSQNVVEALQSEALRGSLPLVKTLVEREVAPHIDTQIMTRWALGKHWRAANEEQRKEIESLFRQLLIQTYAVGLMQFTGEEVIVLNARKDKYGDVLVRTEIVSANKPKPLPVNYRMRNDGKGNLKAYDIIIEGISFLTTYRSSFDSLATQSGIEGLLAVLREKTSPI